MSKNRNDRRSAVSRCGGASRTLLACAVFAASLHAGGAASANDALDVRCETRTEARPMYGRNYVLDRVTECRRVVSADAVEPAEVATRPAPPTGWEGAVVGAERVTTWSGDRRTLQNAQFDRTVRAVPGITRVDVE